MRTVQQLYNVDSFYRTAKAAQQSKFKDALGGVVLSTSLEYIDPTIFEKKYPALTFLNSGVVLDNSGGFADTITSLRLKMEGEFAIAGDASDNKGKISVKGEDNKISVVHKSAFSDWTNIEARQAELQNINLVQQYLETHGAIYQRELDEIGLLGFSNGQEGLLNWSGFMTTPATGLISTLTSAQMYDDIADLIDSQWNAIANTEAYRATRVIMGVDILNTLNRTIFDTSGTNHDSVLVALKQNFPSVEFLGTFRQVSDAASRTVAYSITGDSMRMRIPHPLEIGQIIQKNSFDFQVDSFYRTSGLDVLDDTAGYTLIGL